VSSLVAISGFESTKLEDTGLISAFLDASGEAYLAPSNRLRETVQFVRDISECDAVIKGNLAAKPICTGFPEIVDAKKFETVNFGGEALVSFTAQGCPYQVGITFLHLPDKLDHKVYTRASRLKAWIGTHVSDVAWIENPMTAGEQRAFPGAWKVIVTSPGAEGPRK